MASNSSDAYCMSNFVSTFYFYSKQIKWFQAGVHFRKFQISENLNEIKCECKSLGSFDQKKSQDYMMTITMNSYIDLFGDHKMMV